MKVTLSENNQGIHIDLDLKELKWTDEQKKVVKKLLASSKFEDLSKRECELIKDLKITLGGSKPVELAGLVSFNWNWLSIDPKTKTK